MTGGCLNVSVISLKMKFDFLSGNPIFQENRLVVIGHKFKDFFIAEGVSFDKICIYFKLGNYVR